MVTISHVFVMTNLNCISNLSSWCNLCSVCALHFIKKSYMGVEESTLEQLENHGATSWEELKG